MGSVIVSQTIGGIPDQRIALTNSYFARPHGITSWSKIRVAVRIQMENNAANITSTPIFFMGLCAGTSAPAGSLTPTHAVGLLLNGVTWTYQVGPPVNYSVGSTAVNSAAAVYLNSSTPTVAQIETSTSFYLMADPTAATRSMLFIDITKGSPNYTFKSFYRNLASAGDVLASDFLTQAEIGTPSFTNHSVSNVTPTLAVNEAANGALDCINVWWNRSAPRIHICDIAAVRLA